MEPSAHQIRLEELIKKAFIAGVLWERLPSGQKLDENDKPVTTTQAAEEFVSKIRVVLP